MRSIATLFGLALLTLCLAPATNAQFWEAAGNGISGEQALSARAIHATQTGTLLYGGGVGSGDPASADAGIYRSTDGGQSWTQVLSEQSPRGFAELDGDLYAATVTNGVYKSTDDGQTWTTVNNGLTRSDFYAIAASESEGTLMAGTITGTFRSFNGGTTWSPVNDVDTNALAFGEGENVWAGNFNAGFDMPGIYKSTSLGDNGTWEPSGLDNESLNAIIVASNGDVYTGVSPEETTPGIYRSTDDGASWSAVDAPDFTVYDFVELSDGTFWAASSFGALRSTDSGTTWALENSGTPDDDIAVRSLTLNPSDGRLYIAERFQNETAVYRSVNPVVPVSAENDATADTFGLQPVFPNPTARAATLSFTLDRAADITFAVYDVLGREVARVAEGFHRSGDHRLSWRTAEVPNGVYLVRLAVGDRVETRRVTVVR
jgi:photosystem II stability/assembly factor-like uncharacterized protein